MLSAGTPEEPALQAGAPAFPSYLRSRLAAFLFKVWTKAVVIHQAAIA